MHNLVPTCPSFCGDQNVEEENVSAWKTRRGGRPRPESMFKLQSWRVRMEPLQGNFPAPGPRTSNDKFRIPPVRTQSRQYCILILAVIKMQASLWVDEVQRVVTGGWDPTRPPGTSGFRSLSGYSPYVDAVDPRRTGNSKSSVSNLERAASPHLQNICVLGRCRNGHALSKSPDMQMVLQGHRGALTEDPCRTQRYGRRGCIHCSRGERLNQLCGTRNCWTC